MTFDWSTASSTLSSFLKIRFGTALAIFIASALLLGLPDAYLEKVALREFASTHREQIGITFLISVTLVVGQLFNRFHKWITDHREVTRLRSERVEALQNLSPDEKAFLRVYLEEGTRCQRTQPQGIVTALEQAGIVRRPSQVVDWTYNMDYALAPWAWTLLIKNPEFIDLTEEKIRKTPKRKKRVQGEEW